jgi:hypothetical protein
MAAQGGVRSAFQLMGHFTRGEITIHVAMDSVEIIGNDSRADGMSESPGGLELLRRIRHDHHVGNHPNQNDVAIILGQCRGQVQYAV